MYLLNCSMSPSLIRGGERDEREGKKFFFSSFLFSFSFLLFALSGVGEWDLWHIQSFLKLYNPIKIN